jgi:hypothetical protein
MKANSLVPLKIPKRESSGHNGETPHRAAQEGAPPRFSIGVFLQPGKRNMRFLSLYMNIPNIITKKHEHSMS